MIRHTRGFPDEGFVPVRRNWPAQPRSYMADYERLAAANDATRPTVSSTAGSDIRPESVGGIYPLAIVGYGNGDAVTWGIENLKTGKRFSWIAKASGQMLFSTVKGAIDSAAALSDQNDLDGVSWR